MFNIVKKQENIRTILYTVFTIDEANKILEEEAKKGGGVFDAIEDGIQLVRKDNMIQEIRKSVKIEARSRLTSWLLSPIKEVNSELIAEYMIEEVKLGESTGSKVDEVDEVKLDEVKDDKNMEKKDLMRLLITINSVGELKIGLIDCGINIQQKEYSLDEIRQNITEIDNKLRINNLSDKVNLNILNKVLKDYIVDSDNTLKLINKQKRKKQLTIDDIQNKYDVEIAIKLLSLISNDRIDDYVGWLYINYALHNINECLYEYFVELSEDYYTEDDCKIIWDYRDDDFGLNDLHKWASSDSPYGYNELMNKLK